MTLLGSHRLSLVLFLTRGSSLKVWQDAGLLSREMAIYQRLHEMGVRITVVTYGGRDELDFKRQFPGIEIICNRWSLPENWYIHLLPHLVDQAAGKQWIGKSNQTLGADIGLRTARNSHKFVARSGYLLSFHAEKSHGSQSVEVRRARALEKYVMGLADKIVVTTKTIMDSIASNYKIDYKKIVVIPNYVDTSLFKPMASDLRKKTIGYVGRLIEKKNPSALLKAMKGVDAKLVFVGDGELLDELQLQANQQDIEAKFTRKIMNDKLPSILNSWDLFVLPSFYEGHPKSLLEAMACGLPVIATDVPGNRELIRHGIDGYLCGTSSSEIRDAILNVLGDEDLSRRLGANARKRIVEEFSLDRVADLEAKLLLEMSRQ